MGPYILPILVALSLILILFLYDRLQSFVQPARLQLARLGEELRGDERLTEDQVEYVEFMLDHSHSWVVMVVACVMVPLSAALELFRSTAQERAQLEVSDPRMRLQFEEVERLFVMSTAARNPLFFALLQIQLAVIFLFLLSTGRTVNALLKLQRSAVLHERRAARSLHATSI